MTVLLFHLISGCLHSGDNGYIWLLEHASVLIIYSCLIHISQLGMLISLLITNSSVLSEKAMATYPSTLAWKIPWTEEPGGLQFMGSLGVGHDWATSLSLFTFMHWRRKWQPTPVCLPGESQGWRSLVGCHLWSHRVGHDWSNLAAFRSFQISAKMSFL